MKQHFDAADWRAFKQQAKERRAERRRLAPDELREAGIAFTEHNEGAHLIVVGGSASVPELWDFWPGTGKWSHRGPPHIAGRGAASLIHRIKGGQSGNQTESTDE